jgi:hypothetical protein
MECVGGFYRDFLDRATDRAILSSLNMVVNSVFLLIHSLLLITASVIAPPVRQAVPLFLPLSQEYLLIAHDHVHGEVTH